MSVFAGPVADLGPICCCWRKPFFRLHFPAEALYHCNRGRHALLRGLENLTRPVLASSETTPLLDPCGRGACDVCPGSPELKVAGAASSGFLLPDHQDQVGST